MFTTNIDYYEQKTTPTTLAACLDCKPVPQEALAYLILTWEHFYILINH